MEQYYRICIDPLPEVRFSLMNSVHNYHWTNPGDNACILEINYVITGSVHFSQGARQETIGRKQLFFLTRSEPFDAYSEEPLYQEYTFGLILSRPAVPAAAGEIAALECPNGEAIMPLNITDPVLTQQVYNLLTAIGAHRRDASDPVRRLMVKARLVELLALLTRYSLQQARRGHSPAERTQNPHCRRACLYVQEHLAEKIRVEDVASAVGISYRRLSSLFFSAMGMTLVDYINAEKIQRVKQLILTENASLKTAGEAVGIENSNYLSTLFRKHTGMTARECRKMRK